MKLKTAAKVPLSKITHSVRASQAVLQYGVGAMVDFPDQTLMTAAPEYWVEKVVKINDERLEKLLHVDYFGMPGGNDELKFKEGISYARFPHWYFCPKCRKFQPIKEWVAEYRRKASEKTLENDPKMVKHMRCTTCSQNLVVARIVTVCEHGHIDDFPWVKWVHRKNMSGAKVICGHPDLRFKTGASASEGLEGLVVTCETCKAKATLKDAFDPEIFSKLDEKTGNLDFICSGYHPWKNTHEKCTLYPRSMQRGSSSVYFPVTSSSLVIPPYSDKINLKVENSAAFQDCRITLSNVPQELRQVLVRSQLATWTNNISMEIGITAEPIRAVLERKWGGVPEDDYSTLNVKYRAEEYDALNGTITLGENEEDDFVREETDIKEYDVPYIKKISLIHKIREVQALIGYSRLAPIERIGVAQQSEGFVSVKEPETRWYPAYEVRGEGIFIEFDQEKITKWANGNEELDRRVDELNSKYNNSLQGSNNPRNITGKFLLLHTIAHLLIKQLSFECGYSIASLKERIYCSEESEGKKMAGVLIYTASGDSEGTLGGLVRQGRPDCFRNIYMKAIVSAMVCSNDPVCILSKGQGRDSLNLAACHACTLIPETSCEEFNIFLDRAVVLGTFSNKKLGFYCTELYDGLVGWDNSYMEEAAATNEGIKGVHVILSEGGIDCSDMSFPEIWQELERWTELEEEKTLLNTLMQRTDELINCEKPINNGYMKIIEKNEEIQVDLIWKNSKVLLFLMENEENYEKAKNSAWKCFLLTKENFSVTKLIENIKR